MWKVQGGGPAVRFVRIVGWIVAVPVLLVLLGVLVSVVLSPPGAGTKVAADLGAPWRAVVAHRGASDLAPESTLPAYLLAREMGADYLEADMRLTKDGVIILFHDDTPERTTNAAQLFPGREKDPVESFSYDELMQLDAGGWFNEAHPDKARPSFVGLRIMTLDDLLDVAEAASERPGLYLETKIIERNPGLEEKAVETLRSRGWLEPSDGAASQVIFQSFYPESLAKLARLAPDTARILLISTETEAEHGWDNLVEKARELGHGIGPIGFLAWPWNTGPAHRDGLLVHPYVINEAWQMRLLTLFGVDGLFTDRPQLALELFGRGAVDEEVLFRQIGH